MLLTKDKCINIFFSLAQKLRFEKVKIMYYRVCPHCNGNLDPGEKCDCRDEAKIYTEQFKTSSTGQMLLPFMKEERNVCKDIKKRVCRVN